MSKVPIFKIACSKIHLIMGERGLGKTGENYLKEWYTTKKTGRRKDFFAKQVEKGLAVEHIGIEMLSRKMGKSLYKNDEWFEDEYMYGIPDVIDSGNPNKDDDEVTDIKSSWDIFTFPMYDKVLYNKDYDWQLQGYTALTGIKKASITYCLIDTPRPLIDQDLKKLYYKSGGTADAWQPEDWEELRTNYLFDDIPEEDKIRKFAVQRDEAKILAIKTRVELCRDYIRNNLM